MRLPNTRSGLSQLKGAFAPQNSKTPTFADGKLPLYRKTLSRSERRRIMQLIDKERRDRANEEAQTRRALRDLAEGQSRGRMKPDPLAAEVDSLERITQARHKLLDKKLPNMRDLLPLIFSLNGKPYTLVDHFPFEPFYSTRLSRNMVFKTGRQVAKSTNQASQGVLLTNLIPYFNTLFVTPLFEMIRRFSSNYVQPFITESPIRNYFIDTSCTNSVLQRSFRNRSIMYFSYAFQNCDRTRGLNTSKVAYDEVQDMDPRFIPIIQETMSASDWGLSQFTGTPKTLENTIEQLWLDSSMAEFIIPCPHCRYHNCPSLAQDLEKMLGPQIVTREISEKFPAVVCARCDKPVNPRVGFWCHESPELRYKFSGFHIPQMIMPMHYANGEKWAILQGKRMGFGRTPYNVFLNEVCGESADMGAKLLTITDLKRAATLHKNELPLALQARKQRNYKQVVCAVDWGGGGEDEISFTAVAIMGLLPDGKIEVIYGWRSLTPNDPIPEALQILRLMALFKCTFLVHDFGGAGALRETIITQAGLPENRSIPIAYVRVGTGPMVQEKPFNEHTHKRAHHQVDKTRSLQYTCELIKHQYVRFFEYDFHGSDNAGLLHDFLALVEDRVDSRMGQDMATIIRNKMAGPDDFAQAVNIGTMALCHSNEFWPDIAQLAGIRIDPRILEAISPFEADRQMWDY